MSRLRANLRTDDPAVAAMRAEMLRHIQAPLDPHALPHVITVCSLKGGVGKTTVSACLGLLLAEHRLGFERVIAVDSNHDTGTLAGRLIPGKPEVSVQHLLDDLTAPNAPGILSFPDLKRYLYPALYPQPSSRLAVLAGLEDPGGGDAFLGADYAVLIRCLGRFFDIILADCGTGVADAAMRTVLDHTHTLVVAATPSADAARKASDTLDWLAAHGYSRLADNAIAALTHAQPTLERDPRAYEAQRGQFARCRAVIDIPSDPHLASGTLIDPTRLAEPTQLAYLQLAAACIGTAQHPTAP